MPTTYLEYPPSIGQSLKHWVSFRAYDFRKHHNTLDIALYIPPDALATSYKSDYESSSMGVALGESIAALKGSGGSLDRLQREVASRASVASGQVAELVMNAVSPENLKTAMNVVRGEVANPYIVAAYKGPTQLREHKFSFKMMPEDKSESAKCVEIASAFKTAMLPDHAKGDNQTSPTGMFGYPDEFDITFVVNGSELPRNITNPMFNIGRSVLTNCELSYTTQDTVLFFEGTQFPVTINMSLTFMEIEQMYRSKIRGKGL